jgi:hypothetical protein
MEKIILGFEENLSQGAMRDSASAAVGLFLSIAPCKIDKHIVINA